MCNTQLGKPFAIEDFYRVKNILRRLKSCVQFIQNKLCKRNALSQTYVSSSFLCLLRGSEVRASISWATGGRWKWSHMSARRKLGRNWRNQSTGRCVCCCYVFTNNGCHHCMDEFSHGNLPSSELQIYTWMDVALKKLVSLVKEVYPEAGYKNTHSNFAIVLQILKDLAFE